MVALYFLPHGSRQPAIAVGVESHPLVATRYPDFGELVRSLDGERAKTNGVHELENRRVGANSEGERADGNRRKAQIESELPRAESNVLREIFDPPGAARVAAVLFDLLNTAQCKPRATTGVVGREARPLQLGGFVIEVQPELVIELGLDGPALRQRAQAIQQIGEHDVTLRTGRVPG